MKGGSSEKASLRCEWMSCKFVWLSCFAFRLPIPGVSVCRLARAESQVAYGEPEHLICSAVSFELWGPSIRSSLLQDAKTATDKKGRLSTGLSRA